MFQRPYADDAKPYLVKLQRT